ncbi:TetR-like C-terminal domain-containing protein, partial [Streptomyces sp. NRRL B-24572]
GAFAAQGLPAPASGSLYGDLRVLLEVASHALRHPVASQVIPDLLVEAARHPEIAETVKAVLLDGQQGVMTQVVRAAVARGELPEGTDPGKALDLAVGPLYWRLVVVRTPLPKGYVDELARAAVAALKA